MSGTGCQNARSRGLDGDRFGQGFRKKRGNEKQ